MKKAMVFGTFDILHKGHEYLLNQAKKYGFLVAAIARDKNVKKIKGRRPVNNERQRMKNLRKLKIADKVVLGYIKEPYKIIAEENPDIICLGYDQSFFVEGLEKWLKDKKMNVKVVRLKPHKPHKYKSSLLRERTKL